MKPPKPYYITLAPADVLQILDGLESRAESWEWTARYLSVEQDGSKLQRKALEAEMSEHGLIEECSDADEAKEIARHYRDIIKTIETQVEQQNKKENS